MNNSGLILLSRLYDISIDELLNGDSRNINYNTSANIEHENFLPYTSNEQLFLAILVILSCLFQGMGIFVSMGMIVWLRKNQKKYLKIILLCIACFIISTYNFWIFMNQLLFHIGTFSIEKI